MKNPFDGSKPHRIILLGANGSGKSTLGRELARVLNIAHIDVEGYYFYKAEIPYTAMRPAEERNAMLLSDMKKHGSFVMSGDISGWGEEFITGFDLVIFLTAPTNIRLMRIENREYVRWGDRVRQGGDMYDSQQKFREFAASRDIPQLEQRASLYSCPILHIDGTKTLEENIDEILTYMNTRNHCDALIDETNDPVSDPVPLKAYTGKGCKYGKAQSMNKIEIKKAKSADIPIIESILLDTVNWLNEMDQPLWKAENVVWSMLSKSYTINDFYIAFIDGKPSGCMAILDADPFFWPDVHKGDSLFVHKLAVTKPARKTGVADALINLCKRDW